MEMTQSDRCRTLDWLGPRFGISGDLVSIEPCGNGHINQTWAACYQNGSGPIKRIHQRINHHVFRDPLALMRNIQLVTKHVRDSLELKGERQIDRKVLTLIPTSDGELCTQDAEGYFWRTYLYIEDSLSFEVVPSPQEAREAAAAFARFQRCLMRLPAESLNETLANFHNTSWRFSNLVKAIEADRVNRAGEVGPEIDFALSRSEMVDVLLREQREGKLPLRITHNDTKVNNVLMDRKTRRALCVIDLDTVMPGLSLYDFGDMVRTAIATAQEDEIDLSKVGCNLALFEGLVQGYLEEAGNLLNQTERSLLVFSGRLITFEMGLRFLTDYLEGDTYYTIRRPSHNLDRARTQFAMVQHMERLEPQMQRIVQTYSA